MLRTIGLLVLVGLLAAAAPVRVNDAFNIKLKKSSKGDITQRKNEESEASHAKVEGPDGKVINEEKKSKTTIEEYKETILAKEKGKRATKLRREYSKAILKANDKEKTLPYDGKTLLIEKKGDKYHFTIEGGEEVKGEDAQSLNQMFNNRVDDSDNEQLEKAFLPKKPVAVNDMWKIDPEELVKALAKGKQALPVDQSKVTGTGMLLRAYKKDGRQYGIFNIEVKLPLKGDFPLGPNAKAPIREGSILSRIKLDTCIDGTSNDTVSEMSMKTDFVAGIKAPGGQELKLTVHVTHKGKEIETDLSKK
jgi:hypothetical protein